MSTAALLAISLSPEVFALVLAGLLLAVMAILGAREIQHEKVEAP